MINIYSKIRWVEMGILDKLKEKKKKENDKCDI